MKRTELINRIETFADLHGLAPATVTSRAVGNSRLYARMKAGGGCGLETAERLQTYMAENSAGTNAVPVISETAPTSQREVS